MPESKFTSGASAWSDEDFLRAFEDLSFPADLFHHREHIHLAWLYLKSTDASRAAEHMSEGIRRFANHHGAPQKYHHTFPRGATTSCRCLRGRAKITLHF